MLSSARATLPLALLLTSCIEVAPPPPAAPVSLVSATAPEGVGLETACTPTGVELCFNARDDNCNGILDEGCGLETGLLQFTIAWDASVADVDLNVSDPGGQLATVGDPTEAGLVKDRDCPRPECQGQNVENVFLAQGDPRRGRYHVVVRLDKLNGAPPPVKVRLGVRVGQRSFGASVDLAPGAATETRSFDFTL